MMHGSLNIKFISAALKDIHSNIPVSLYLSFDAMRPFQSIPRTYFHKILVTTVFLLLTFYAHIQALKILIASFIKVFLFFYALR
jgi:uncharacterized membrane protein